MVLATHSLKDLLLLDNSRLMDIDIDQEKEFESDSSPIKLGKFSK